MNILQWKQHVLTSDQRIAIPIMTHPGIEHLGFSVEEVVRDGAKHAAAVQYLASRYPSAAATMAMDLTVEAEAFGCQIQFHRDEIPSIVQPVLNSIDAVDTLTIPMLVSGRFPEYLKATEIAAKTCNLLGKPLFSGCIGPYSLAGRLFDMTGLMMAIFESPESVERLLEKASELILNYVKAIKQSGASGVVMAEPAAGLLSEDMVRDYSTRYIRPIVEATQDDTFLFVLHNCGNHGHCTQAMVETGAGALHLGNSANISEVLATVPVSILVMGNIDPVSAFKLGTPQEMEKTVENLLSQTAKYPNFILSSGCDTPPGVNELNIQAFFETLERYNIRSR